MATVCTGFSPAHRRRAWSIFSTERVVEHRIATSLPLLPGRPTSRLFRRWVVASLLFGPLRIKCPRHLSHGLVRFPASYGVVWWVPIRGNCLFFIGCESRFVWGGLFSLWWYGSCGSCSGGIRKFSRVFLGRIVLRGENNENSPCRTVVWSTRSLPVGSRFRCERVQKQEAEQKSRNPRSDRQADSRTWGVWVRVPFSSQLSACERLQWAR